MNSVYYYSPQSPTFSQLLHKHMYHFTLQTCATVLGKVSYVCVKEMMMMMMLLFGSYSSDPPFFGIVVSQQLYRHNFPLPPTPLQVSQAFFFSLHVSVSAILCARAVRSRIYKSPYIRMALSSR